MKKQLSPLNNILCILIILFCFANIGFSQSIEEIKLDRETYIWGEGDGSTISEADKHALYQIVSQISTQVESSFNQTTDIKNGEQTDKVKMIVRTYSKATLHNTERIVVSNEPDAIVFRYIKRADLHKVFEQRKNKILEFVTSAIEAEKDAKIADALRYYYWALNLLKSHPESNDIYYHDVDANLDRLLVSWIPTRMNDIFSEIRFASKDIKTEDNLKIIDLDIRYKDRPAVNLDYSYWDGRDWTNLISAKDGNGFLEYTGLFADDLKEAKIKVEYIFIGEARIDRELEDVMAQIDPVPFRNSYFTLSLPKTVVAQSNTAESKETKAEFVKASMGFAPVTNSGFNYEDPIREVMKAVETIQYESVKHLFSESGYDMFNRLIAYGNAKIIADPVIKTMGFNGGVMCRSIPMSFSFSNNTKKIVENVVFHFNPDNLIESISFGLSESAANDILNKTVWDEKDRYVLINFLENYKTAYALKRLNYIESIFADDALIITGYEVQVKNNENRFANNKIIRYNRYTKQEYLKKLKYSFESKEYINLKFEDSEIRKGGVGGNIYGVQIKQNYYSSNYGDVGYLFLMVDLNEPDTPVIHVRTWQPEKNPDGTIYGLSDF